MKILDRHLINSFLSTFVFCLTILLSLFVVIDTFNNLDDFIKNSASVPVILSYYMYLLPSLVVQIIPISVLVSVLFALGGLTKHNEIIAMKASGIRTQTIILPYLFVGLVISFCVLYVSETIVPQASMNATSIKEGLIDRGKKNMQERAIKNVTLYGASGRMIYAREFEMFTETLYDIVVLEDRTGGKLKTKITARKAHYEDGKWIFEDVIKHNMNPRGNLVGEPSYSPKLILELPEKPKDFLNEASQIDYMNARQLRDYMGHLKGSGKRLSRKLNVEFHNKIAFPFISFIVIIIGAPLAMRSERGSAMVGVGTSLIVVLLYYAADSIALALGKGGFFPPFFAAWASNLLFAGVGLYWIAKSQ